MILPLEAAQRPDDLAGLTDATIVDLARGPAYRRGHVPGAWHVSGPALARDLAGLPGDGPIVLTSPDGQVAEANLTDARGATARPVLVLAGGTRAWTEASRPLETDGRFVSKPIDVYKRPYEGTDNARAAMQGYIDREFQLVVQLANDGMARFPVVRSPEDGAGPA